MSRAAPIAFGLATVALIGLGFLRASTAPPPAEPVPMAHPGDDALLLPSRRRELEAVAAHRRAAGHAPRTRHLKPDGTPLYTNRLVETASPYLQQHAHNPVGWFPWGEEALERARALDRPILLSIGYATCHWCHVMEEESFEDPAIASVINAHFVPVKVDRETRPDLDALYMRAVTLSLGRGGWPATLVLFPDGRPFFAATYLPPRDGDRGRSRGLMGLLTTIASDWDQDRSKVEGFATRLTEAIREDLEHPAAAGLPGPEAVHALLAWAHERYDPVNGGTAGVPKFPSSLPLSVLLAGDDDALTMARTTLDRMAAGGIYDHVGGGFHRYSTDAAWQVPHFEKMLYDNTQLARVYGEAFQRTGDLRYARVVHETLEMLVRDFAVDGSGFASALDADSPGPDGVREEGLSYTWTPRELAEVLGDDAAGFAAAYGVTEAGNLDGRSVLHQSEPPTLAERDRFGAARLKLLLARRERPQPLRDDKVLTSWNGLAIDAFAYNGWLMGRDDWIDEARATADRILDTRVDGRLQRVADEDGGTAFLDDYAFVADGLITLFEATGEPRWLDETLALLAVAERYHGTDGPWFRTPSDHESLLTRDRPLHDGPIPSANSVLVRVFVRLHALTGDDTWRVRADDLGRALAVADKPAGAPNALLALTSRPLNEVVLVTAPGERSSALHAALKTAPPSRRVLVQQVDGEPAVVPLAADKVRLGAPTAYVCQGGVCDRPTTDPATLVKQLRWEQSTR